MKIIMENIAYNKNKIFDIEEIKDNCYEVQNSSKH